MDAVRSKLDHFTRQALRDLNGPRYTVGYAEHLHKLGEETARRAAAQKAKRNG